MVAVVDCDTMLMLLAASRDMPERERDIVTRELIRGFNGMASLALTVLMTLLTRPSADLAHEAGTKVTGGQTVVRSTCRFRFVRCHPSIHPSIHRSSCCQSDESVAHHRRRSHQHSELGRLYSVSTTTTTTFFSTRYLPFAVPQSRERSCWRYRDSDQASRHATRRQPPSVVSQVAPIWHAQSLG